MGEPDERQPKLKFKRILLRDGPLMPQGYRLAMVEEIRKYLEILKKNKMPVRKINPFYDEDSGDIRLLDGWVTADYTVVHETPNYNCVWNAVVKVKTWDRGRKNWQNCADLYSSPSSGSNSLRKELYSGISIDQLSSQGKDTAWFYAYYYEDVEVLYWLWLNFPYSFEPERFRRECRPENIHLDINHVGGINFHLETVSRLLQTSHQRSADSPSSTAHIMPSTADSQPFIAV